MIDAIPYLEAEKDRCEKKEALIKKIIKFMSVAPRHIEENKLEKWNELIIKAINSKDEQRDLYRYAQVIDLMIALKAKNGEPEKIFKEVCEENSKIFEYAVTYLKGGVKLAKQRMPKTSEKFSAVLDHVSGVNAAVPVFDYKRYDDTGWTAGSRKNGARILKRER